MTFLRLLPCIFALLSLSTLAASGIPPQYPSGDRVVYDLNTIPSLGGDGVTVGEAIVFSGNLLFNGEFYNRNANSEYDLYSYGLDGSPFQKIPLQTDQGAFSNPRQFVVIEDILYFFATGENKELAVWHWPVEQTSPQIFAVLPEEFNVEIQTALFAFGNELYFEVFSTLYHVDTEAASLVPLEANKFNAAISFARIEKPIELNGKLYVNTYDDDLITARSLLEFSDGFSANTSLSTQFDELPNDAAISAIGTYQGQLVVSALSIANAENDVSLSESFWLYDGNTLTSIDVSIPNDEISVSAFEVDGDLLFTTTRYFQPQTPLNSPYDFDFALNPGIHLVEIDNQQTTQIMAPDDSRYTTMPRAIKFLSFEENYYLQLGNSVDNRIYKIDHQDFELTLLGKNTGYIRNFADRYPLNPSLALIVNDNRLYFSDDENKQGYSLFTMQGDNRELIPGTDNMGTFGSNSFIWGAIDDKTLLVSANFDAYIDDVDDSYEKICDGKSLFLFDTEQEMVTCLLEVRSLWSLIETEDGFVVYAALPEAPYYPTNYYILSRQTKSLEPLYSGELSNVSYFAYINGQHYLRGRESSTDDMYRLNTARDEAEKIEGFPDDVDRAWYVEQGIIVANDWQVYLIGNDDQVKHLNGSWGSLIDGSAGRDPNLYVHTVRDNKVYFFTKYDNYYAFDIATEQITAVPLSEFVRQLGLNRSVDTDVGTLHLSRDPLTGYDHYALTSIESDTTVSATGDNNLLCNNSSNLHIYNERAIRDDADLSGRAMQDNETVELDGQTYTTLVVHTGYIYSNLIPAIHNESGKLVFIRGAKDRLVIGNKAYGEFSFSDDSFYTGDELGYELVESQFEVVSPLFFSAADVQTRGDAGVKLVAELDENLTSTDLTVKWDSSPDSENPDFVSPIYQKIGFEGSWTLEPTADFSDAEPGKYLFTVEIESGDDMSCLRPVIVTVDPDLNNLPSITVTQAKPAYQVGETADLAATATDDDGDSVILSWSQVSGSVPLDLNSNNGSVSFVIPEAEKNTPIVLEVTATDSFGGVATQQVTFEIDPRKSGGSMTVILLFGLLLLVVYRLRFSQT